MHRLLFVFLLVAAPVWGQQSSTGNLTAAGTVCASSTVCITLPLDQTKGGAGFTLSGTWSATVQFEGSADGGVTFQAINATPSNSTTAVTSATGNGVWQANVAGFTHVRIRCSAFSSGTIVATINASSASARANGGSGGGAGNGAGAGGEAIMGFTLSPNCLAANTGQCFQTFANTQQAVDCSWVAAGTTVACTASHFTAADIGKRVFGFKNCDAFNAAIASDTTATSLTNTDGTGAKLTISAQSGTGITFTGGTVAHSSAGGNVNCLIWGNPDDTAAALMDTAAQAAPFCSKLLFVSSNYMFTDPHFYTNPTACANAGSTHGAGSVIGNLFYAAGYELEGRGQGATLWYLTPTFPENSTCNHGRSTIACFVQPVEGRWSNFQITAGQNFHGVSSVGLIEFDGPGSVENFTCTNWGANNNTTVGFLVAQWEQLIQVDNSGCGYTGIRDAGSNSGFTGMRVRVENSPINLNLTLAGVNNCYDCGFFGSVVSVGTALILNTGAAQLNLYRASVTNGGSLANVVGYLASTTAGSVLEIYGSSWSTNSGSNSSGIKCSAACQSYIEGTGISASGTGNPYADVSGSILFDLGANNFVGGAGVSIGGQVRGSSSIGSLTTLATGNVVIGTCGTSAATLFSGSSQKGQFTITAAGTPGTACTATVTFPTAFWQTPICTWYDVGGTNAVATSIVNGTTNTTTTAATFSGPTFTNGNTEIVQYACANP